MSDPTTTTKSLADFDYRRTDGGRKAAGYKGIAGDCVTRAAAVLLGEHRYREIYNEMARSNKAMGGSRSARNGLSGRAYRPVIERHGYKLIEQRNRIQDRVSINTLQLPTSAPSWSGPQPSSRTASTAGAICSPWRTAGSWTPSTPARIAGGATK